MTVPQLQLHSGSALDVAADALVIGVARTDHGPRLLCAEEALLELGDSLAAIGVTGAQDELVRIPGIGGLARSLALIGVGTGTSPNELRYAAGSAARQLRGARSLAIALPCETRDGLLAVLEGAAIGAYGYEGARSTVTDPAKSPAKEIVVVTSQTDAEPLVARAAIVASAIHDVRDLVNAPPSELYPESFASAALDLADGVPVDIQILREPELLKGGFGGILGVGQGSARGPRLVKVSYSPAEARKHIAFVGKGITFDSGGLSLKPPTSMVGMKTDMAGAATVLAVTLAAARLGLDVRLTAWLCIAENLPSGTALRPTDVLRMYGGKTVEVLNTDAEGRLVLADGLAAASEEHPDAIIDVATLTGASRVALGDRYVGTMGDPALVQRIIETADRVGETLWAMPLPAELRAGLNSEVADIANVRSGNSAAGMLVAGVFLREFVGTRQDGTDGRSIPWAHLDIAAPSNNTGAGYGFVGRGATGVAVRSLLALAEEFSAA